MQYYGDLLRKLTKSNTTDVCEFFTKKCLSNAKSRSKNEAMKRFFMISAVSANDGLKELLERNDLTFSNYWVHRRYFSKVKDGVPLVVKSYLSCMLLIMASQKPLIYQKTGMTEQDLLSFWCDIFIYTDYDKEYFNRIVKKIGFGKDGLHMIFAELNGICHEYLCGGEPDNLPCTDDNRDFLMNKVAEDVFILMQRLQECPNVVS